MTAGCAGTPFCLNAQCVTAAVQMVAHRMVAYRLIGVRKAGARHLLPTISVSLKQRAIADGNLALMPKRQPQKAETSCATLFRSFGHARMKGKRRLGRISR
ncbi:hypothetical protein AV944_06855 [Sphingomonas sp. LK11]|nr:hypothetical protein AV944_06855 [Sphingomonas sp. LK11]